MSDDDVIDRPADHLPEAIRREMARQKRQGDGKSDVDPPAEPERGPEPVPSLERLSPLPVPGDPYKAYARPENKMVLTLVVLTGDGRKWGFPYSARMEGPHMLPGEAGQGDIILLRFNVGLLVQLTLCGQMLDELHNYLADHRIRWVREAPKGRIVKPGGIPIITRVAVERVADWPPPSMA
jgi:hypothetical protein